MSARAIQRAAHAARRNSGILAACALVGVAGGWWYDGRAERLFRASASIRYDDGAGPLSARLRAPRRALASRWADPMTSELHLLRSRVVLGAVVDAERLRVVSGRRGPRLAMAAPDAGEPPARHREIAIDLLNNGMSARIRDGSDVVDVSYTSPDPELSRTVVNTIVVAYTAHMDLRAGSLARRQAEYLQSGLADVDAEVAGTRQALGDLQRRTGAYSSAGRARAQQAALLRFDAERDALIAERSALATLLDAGGAVTAIGAAPGLTGTPAAGQALRYRARRDSLDAAGTAAGSPDRVMLDSLIAAAERSLRATAAGRLAAIDARLHELAGSRTRLADDVAAAATTRADEAALLLRLEAALRTADRLRTAAGHARLAEAAGSGPIEILDFAVTPDEPVPTGTARAILIGLLLGAAAGMLGAAGRERLATAIGAAPEAAALLDLTPLATLPRLGRADPTVVAEPDSAGAEAFRTLRTALLFAGGGHGCASVVVTSASPGEGRTTVAVNLAVCCAQQELRVLLVDADLRQPRVHELLDADLDGGLVDLIRDTAGADALIVPGPVPGMAMLTAGTPAPNPAELVGGPRMREVVARLAAAYDIVVFDTPPVLAATESALLARLADATIVVLRAGTTDRDAAAAAVAQLRRVGAEPLGFVFNDARAATRWAPGLPRAAVAALAAPLYLHSGRWRTLLDTPAERTRSRRAPPSTADVERITRLLARLPLSPWRATCLYRSVAVCLALRAAGVPAVLRLGAAANGDGASAHAWVEDDDGRLLYERRDGFTPLRPA